MTEEAESPISWLERRPPLADAPNELKTAVVTVFFLSNATSLLGTALTPWLLVHAPLLLVALAPAGHNVLLVAPLVDAIPLVGVCVLRRLIGLTATFGFGALYGHHVVRWSQRGSRRMATFVRLLGNLSRRFGPHLLVVYPQYSLATIMGATGSRLPPFLVGVVVGQLIQLTLTLVLGRAISEFLHPLLEAVRAHAIPATAATAGAVVAFVWYQRRKRSRGPTRSKAADQAATLESRD